jgi:hypothetical protein
MRGDETVFNKVKKAKLAVKPKRKRSMTNNAEKLTYAVPVI